MSVDVAVAGRVLQAVLEDAGTPLLLHDRAIGETLPLPVRTVSDPRGLLPAFLAAGDAVREDATGRSFGLRIVCDAGTLLGYRVEAIGNGPFSAVLLFTMEAAAQASGPDRLLVNDLIGAVWQAVMDRAERASPAAVPPPARPPSPASGSAGPNP